MINNVIFVDVGTLLGSELGRICTTYVYFIAYGTL